MVCGGRELLVVGVPRAAGIPLMIDDFFMRGAAAHKAITRSLTEQLAKQ